MLLLDFNSSQVNPTDIGQAIMKTATQKALMIFATLIYASTTPAAYPILELYEKNGALLCAFTMTSGTQYTSNPPERATCPRLYIPIEYLVIANPKEGITFTLGDSDWASEKCDTQGTPQYAVADLANGEATPRFPTNAGVQMPANTEIVAGIRNVRTATKMVDVKATLCVVIVNPNQ